jgi:hypothetical protein
MKKYTNMTIRISTQLISSPTPLALYHQVCFQLCITIANVRPVGHSRCSESLKEGHGFTIEVTSPYQNIASLYISYHIAVCLLMVLLPIQLYQFLSDPLFLSPSDRFPR